MKKLFVITALATIMFSINSCKTKGCTGADATNFNASANSDDGTCQYNGNILLWVNDNTANNWGALQSAQGNNLQSLTISVAGSSTAAITLADVTTYTSPTAAPTCSQGSVFSFALSLGNSLTKTFTVTATGTDGAANGNNPVTIPGSPWTFTYTCSNTAPLVHCAAFQLQ